MKDILGEISKLREARKWSEYDLAKKSGLTQSTISTWYRKNQIPTIASLNKVCIGFGISLSQFFAEGDEPMSLTQEQREMLDKWSMLNKKQQQVLAELLDNMQ
ncbi:helix-turn-helix domain-containing protein [Bengtsoniella intestinalis]|uniref:helix-turn-helix domain-containing protein n=1 Tax=Bengtsoniella intestinalis TaxID=3073143 RepID=UPI00391F6A5F